MTSPVTSGSVSLSGLLGGTAGQIDVTALISQLMTAARVPQGQLYDQLNNQQLTMGIYQTINAKMTSLQTAANTLTDPSGWTAMAATSSDGSVVASSSDGSFAGSSTFSVTQTAAAQVTTITSDAAGNVLADPSGFITIKGVQITPPTGSATNVAAAINGANLGVRASVIQSVDGRSVLQLTSSVVGSDGAFTVDPGNLTNPPTDIQAARNARIEVGDPAAGGYAVESRTNTFTGVIPGVTFTVSASASNVTISVAQDTGTITSRVKALVDAANNIASELGNDTQQGSPLQGTSTLNQLRSGIGNAVAYGTVGGRSLYDYGIDMDKDGVISFDADKFAAAYAADPDATKAAINGFANNLKSTANSAIDPTYGSLTLSMQQITDTEARLNDSITAWNDRLDMMQANLQAKFLAMQTSLATLQSRQTYLTSMFKSMDSNSDSNS